jgi:ATP-binding cassette subfamily C protein
MPANLRRSVALLAPRERRQWAALLPLAALTSAVEAVGTATVFVLIKVATDPPTVHRLPVVRALYAELPWQSGRAVVLSFAALVGAFFLLRNVLLAAVGFYQQKVLAETTASLSTRLFEAYLRAPWPFHLAKNSADLIHAVTVAADRVVQLSLGSAVQLVSEAFVAAGLVCVLMTTAPLVTLATAAGVGLLLATSLRLTRRRIRRWAALREELGRATIEDAQQALGGLKEIKVLGREPAFLAAFDAHAQALGRVRRRQATLGTLPRLIVETVFVLGVLLVVALVTLRGRTGPDVVSLLGLYAYAGFRLIPAANRVLLALNSMRHSGPAVERIAGDLAALGPRGEAAGGTAPEVAFLDRIALERVSYSYEGAPRPVLEDVSLEIRRGASVGIVGASGAGKSTLVDLVLGLLAPTRGRITVDGADIGGAVRAWQRKIGYVPQSVFIVDDSVRRNIALGVPAAEIDEARVRAAVAMAQLDETVAGLARGLDTAVGERGVRLSGGQRQRIGIARALYHDPELLVFDEATSALDGLTEREVTRAIDSLQGRKTLIVIAHRLTTVRRCDRLVFLREGRLEAVDSFEGLLARSPEFRAMAALAALEGTEPRGAEEAAAPRPS